MIKKLLAVIVIVALPYLILRARNPEPEVNRTTAPSDSAGRAAVRISPKDCALKRLPPAEWATSGSERAWRR
ncbi:MAG TPA: hypothetical protein VLJ83_10745 [Gemmatimonadaceae bacterium]|nr:hypothetical protein [Gemmatimonadaceae bacterium]